MTRNLPLILIVLSALCGSTYAAIVGPIAPGSTITLATNGEIAGQTLDGVTVNFSGSGQLIHGCTLINGAAINVGEASNFKIVHNTFKGTRSYAVSGYPGDNGIVEYNDVDLTGIGPGGVDNNGSEWLHFISGASGGSISYNTIKGNTLRWAIELQSGMQNLKVDGNYITHQAGSAISCATGGDATAPYAHQGKNIDIGGNVCINAHTPNIADCALELMGDSGLVVHDNYFSGYGTGILNGTGGQANQSAVTRNNVLISRDANYNKEQFLWTVPDLISTDDKLFKVGAAGIPNPPASPTNTGAASDGQPSTPPLTIPSAIAAPTNLSAAAQTNGIRLACDPYTGAAKYNWTWATPIGETRTQTTVVPMLIDQSVPNFYRVVYNVTATTAAGTSIAASVQVQALGAQNFLPTPPVIVAPTLTKTVKVYSDGSIIVTP